MQMSFASTPNIEDWVGHGTSAGDVMRSSSPEISVAMRDVPVLSC